MDNGSDNDKVIPIGPPAPPPSESFANFLKSRKEENATSSSNGTVLKTPKPIPVNNPVLPENPPVTPISKPMPTLSLQDELSAVFKKHKVSIPVITENIASSHKPPITVRTHLNITPTNNARNSSSSSVINTTTMDKLSSIVTVGSSLGYSPIPKFKRYLYLGCDTSLPENVHEFSMLSYIFHAKISLLKSLSSNATLSRKFSAKNAFSNTTAGSAPSLSDLCKETSSHLTKLEYDTKIFCPVVMEVFNKNPEILQNIREDYAKFFTNITLEDSISILKHGNPLQCIQFASRTSSMPQFINDLENHLLPAISSRDISVRLSTHLYDLLYPKDKDLDQELTDVLKKEYSTPNFADTLAFWITLDDSSPELPAVLSRMRTKRKRYDMLMNVTNFLVRVSSLKISPTEITRSNFCSETNHEAVNIRSTTKQDEKEKKTLREARVDKALAIFKSILSDSKIICDNIANDTDPSDTTLQSLAQRLHNVSMNNEHSLIGLLHEFCEKDFLSTTADGWIANGTTNNLPDVISAHITSQKNTKIINEIHSSYLSYTPLTPVTSSDPVPIEPQIPPNSDDDQKPNDPVSEPTEPQIPHSVTHEESNSGEELSRTVDHSVQQSSDTTKKSTSTPDDVSMSTHDTPHVSQNDLSHDDDDGQDKDLSTSNKKRCSRIPTACKPAIASAVIGTVFLLSSIVLSTLLILHKVDIIIPRSNDPIPTIGFGISIGITAILALTFFILACAIIVKAPSSNVTDASEQNSLNNGNQIASSQDNNLTLSPNDPTITPYGCVDNLILY